MDSKNHKDSDTSTILGRAEAYCAKAEHCVSDIQRKLYEWGCTDSLQQEEIIGSLMNNDFVNEQRYCMAFVHDKFLYQSWGRMKIRAALRSKHLPDKEIEKALATIGESEYLTALKKLIKKKGNAEKTATIRFCLQRGFEYDLILSQIGESFS